MPVNVVRFKRSESSSFEWGIVDHYIHVLNGAWSTTAEFIKYGKSLAIAANIHKEDLEKIDYDEAMIISPVSRPCQVICQGANYRQHMIESGMDPDTKSFNMIFTKSDACITGPYSKIKRPSHVRLLDYEIELGLVIDAPITSSQTIEESDLKQHIAAIVVSNDISARDVQIPQMQFYKGKSYRTFCPVGPYLTLLEPDDFDLLYDLQLCLRVNGEVRQQDSSKNLVFKPAETLSELSHISNLYTGDIVLTGTPSGCALQVPSPLAVRLFGLIPEHKRWPMFIKKQSQNGRYLQAGDIIEAYIKSSDGRLDLGTQRNLIVDQAPI